MDDAARELMELKTLITKTLEKRGVLARIRAELRANVFAAIEEQERTDGDSSAFSLIGACNERAKELHSTQVGKVLSALVCEYLEWCSLDRTLKVYLPEANIPRGMSRPELEEKLALSPNRAGQEDSHPLLLKLLEEHLKPEALKRTASAASTSSSKQTIASSHGGHPKPSNSDYINQLRAMNLGGMRE